LLDPACSVVYTHHWLVRHRGGERVLAALRRFAPAAPVYTLLFDRRYTDIPLFRLSGEDRARVTPSLLQRIPGARRHYPMLLPLMPLAARHVRLPRADLVICSDAALAKAMTPAAGSRVVCYCHSPMRYVWDLADVYRGTLPPPLRPLWGPLVRRLRRVDRDAAQRVDRFVANSRHVAERIRRHYGRDSTVIHPPVTLPPEPTIGPREDFYLCVGHHVAYKRLDLAIEACRRLGRRLVVIGDGPHLQRFPPRDHANVRFCRWQPEPAVHDHYRRARALLFPGEEDFGIVPVEAMAHGCPVIAYDRGGARETVEHKRTGVLFADQSVEGLVSAIEECESLEFDPGLLFEHAQQFGETRFLEEMRGVLRSVLDH
jgi:glycosyltransferase involved in cell wall biosynthesis